MKPATTLLRAATTLAITSGAVLLAATAATAHVTVSSPDAEPGGFGKLVFRVPSESETAKTVSVTVTLPAQSPFAFVSTKAMPDWTAETKTEKLAEPVESDGFKITEAVTEVTWTADKGSALSSGEFTELELSVGPFPEDVQSLTLPASQVYSDGEVVDWDQPTVEGEAEPEHPAPVLELASGTSAAGSGSEPRSATGGPEGNTEAAGSDGPARMLGGVGVALGALAIGIALRGRRRGTA